MAALGWSNESAALSRAAAIGKLRYADAARHFPNAEQALIPKVGHWLHAENPKLFFEVMSQWLQKQQ